MTKKRRYALTALLALILVGSGGYILWKNMDYQKGAADYAQAADAADIPRLEAVRRPEQSEPEPVDPNLALLADVDLESLREVNGDVEAWIVIPGTDLSYPVMRSDDNQYYLKHTWQNNRNSAGAIFMECACAPDFSDFNTILYGHRMRNGSMFGILRNYQKEDFWREHPTIYVVTDSRVQVYDIYAAYEVGIREIVYRLDIEESELEQEFIDFGLERSVIDTGIVPTAEDQVLTLSTCTGHGHAARLVIQAVLVRTVER